MRHIRECLETSFANIFSKGHSSSVNLKYLESSFLVRNTYLNFPVKPARSPKRWVKSAWPIGGAYHYHVASSRQTVHQSKELRYDASFNFASDFLAFGRY